MTDLPRTVAARLYEAAGKLRGIDVPREISLQLETLADQFHQPCVVAVVGRVKAGKSSFVNALLGADLAKVGTTETTATINYFRYGRPDPQRPVACHWRDGTVTHESRAFLDGLQGNDEETLRRASAIDHLEYHLLNPSLERITLVDTPGTGAVVDEHQDRTAEFMRLHGQLRAQHEEETRRLGDSADAVIYLIGPTARTSDRDFLEEFAQATQGKSRALNAVGVMAKIDLQPELLERREELAAKIAAQLQDSLNVVIPVSAGIRRALDQLLAHDAAGLERLVVAMRSIPAPTLEKLLDNEEFFLQLEPADCPVSVTEREALLGDLSWGVFTTIARVAARSELPTRAVSEALDAISGFGPLRLALERQFFLRGQLLRSYRIMRDARRVLGELRYKQLPAMRQRDQAAQTRSARLLAFVDRARGDAGSAAELRDLINEHLSIGAARQLDAVIQDLDRAFAHIFHELEEHNADAEAIQVLTEHAGAFSISEMDELRALLGLYGLDTERRLGTATPTVTDVENRQREWRRISLNDRDAARCDVARRATLRYGLILDEIIEDESRATG